jgi:tetratricopeptide (TPR) repeat protein
MERLRIHLRDRLTFPLLLFSLAWCLRLVYLFEYRESPFFDAPIVDAKTFFESARQIAAGDFLGGNKPFWQPPLYTYLLALIYWLFPTDFFLAARLLQTLLGSLSCVIVYAIAQRATSETGARIAAVMAACYGVFFYFEGELLAVSVEIFLYLLLLHRLLVGMQTQGGFDWLLAGLFSGLAALTRPTILLFVGTLLVWLLFMERRNEPICWRCNLLKRWLLILLPLFLLILPITLRNILIGGDWVTISSNGGINFFIGNNPTYDRTVAIHPGMEWEAMADAPRRAGLRLASEKSAFFTARALSYISQNPLDYAALLLKKIWLFWSGPEIKRNQDIYYARRHSLLLGSLLWDRILSFPFGLIGPLSLLGLALSWRICNQALSLLRLYVLSYTGSVLLFFVTARYRLPVVPILLIFAALALTSLYRNISLRRRKQLALMGLSLLSLLFLLNLPSAPPLDRDAQLQFDLGEVFLRKEAYAQAAEYSLKALALEPTYNYARHNLTVAYFNQERYADAIEQGLRVIAENPLRPDTHIVLGNCFAATGQPQRAFHSFERALGIDSQSGMAHYYYGHLLYRQGDFARAIEHLSQALEQLPDDFWICYELGRAYQLLGRPTTALDYFTRASQIERRPEGLNAIGALHLLGGDLPRAQTHFEQALELDPEYLEALVNMGVVDMERGYFQSGIARLRRVLQLAPRSILGHRVLIELYIRTGKKEEVKRLQQSLNALTH